MYPAGGIRLLVTLKAECQEQIGASVPLSSDDTDHDKGGASFGSAHRY